MPIRFRCAYCNQLLGIARRKAGQVVRCPTCAGQVVVPNPEPEEEGVPQEGGNQPFFEGSDFEELFNPAPRPGPATAAPPPVAEVLEPIGNGPALEVEPLEVTAPPARLPPPRAPREPAPSKPPAGILLSPAKATVLTVVVIVLLALAFGLGLLVGWILRAPPREAWHPSAAVVAAARPAAANSG
jgi:hypothetical protein